MGLREYRKSKGITQKLLAEKVGVKQVTISQYESGVRTPDLKMAKKLADALEITLDVFYQLIVSILETPL